MPYNVHIMMIERNMENTFDKRHGGPWDCGSADSYYRRGRRPHYFVGGTYESEEVIKNLGEFETCEIKAEDMTEAEIAAYNAGFNENEKYGDFKDWGD